MATQPTPFLIPDRYLEIDREAEFKSEYYYGEMFAMADAREAHILISMNVGAELRQQVRKRTCRAYTSDMRVLVNPGIYVYPDASVVCGEPRSRDDRRDTLLNPNLTVEVLSPTTEAYDRGRKFAQYQTLESLTDYLLLSSDRMRAELFTRQPEGRWLLTTVGNPAQALELQSIGCRLTLADLYEKVELPPADSAPLLR